MESKIIHESHVSILGLRPKMSPPLQTPFLTPTLIKRVSICSAFKQLSACTVLMPNNVIPDEL